MQRRKWKCTITDSNDPFATPLYYAEFKDWRQPDMIYKRASDNKTIGTGTLHAFKIDADYELHSRKDTLVAQKASTLYTHLALSPCRTQTNRLR